MENWDWREPLWMKRLFRRKGWLVAELDFAAANQLIINPQAILVGTGLGAGARRTGMQVHARGSLENIGGERAAVDVELDAEIAGVADPGDLIAGIEDHYFRKYTNEDGAFGHAESLQLTVESWKFCG